MTTAHEASARIARTQLPSKPAWLLTFEYLHGVEFTGHGKYRPAVSCDVWGTDQISEAKALAICAEYGVEMDDFGAGLDERFSIRREKHWVADEIVGTRWVTRWRFEYFVSAYQGD